MAEGALKNAPEADIALSVTGIAGPGGGSEIKPVGTVYFGLAVKEKNFINVGVDKALFTSEPGAESEQRTHIRQQAVYHGLRLIRQGIGG